MLVVIMAGVGLQRRLDDRPLRGWLRWGAAGMLAPMAIDLSTNVLVCRVAESARLKVGGHLDTLAGALASRDEPTHALVLRVGLAITLATGATLVLLSRRERVRTTFPPGGHNPTTGRERAHTDRGVTAP